MDLQQKGKFQPQRKKLYQVLSKIILPYSLNIEKGKNYDEYSTL